MKIGILSRNAHRNRRLYAESSELQQRRAEHLRSGGRGDARDQVLQGEVRCVERVLGADDARVEVDEVDHSLTAAFGWVQIFRIRAAGDAEKPADSARLLERIEQGDLAGGEVGGPRMLQPKSGCRREAAGQRIADAARRRIRGRRL